MPDFRTLPKIDLHRHLEGAIRPETLWELHQRERQCVFENFEALRAACTVPRGERPGFNAFLSRFTALYFKYGGLKELERIAAECVSDAAADGVIHLEIRYNPMFWARRLKDNPPGGPLAWLSMAPERAEAVEAAAEAVLTGAEAEAQRRGISVAFILSLGRQFGVAVNRPVSDLISRPVGKRIAGVDLAGHEAIPAAEFRALLDQWRADGKFVTIHAGEDPDGPGPANIIEAIDALGAQRIGHGVRAIEDPALVARLSKMEVAIEMCPTSNFQTLAWRSPMDYPLRHFLDAGVRATINTDDPEISGRITLSGEYLRLHEECSTSFKQLRQCTLNSANAIFLSAKEKLRIVTKVRQGWDK